LLVWHAVIWMIWLVRNELVFVRKVIEPDEIFEKIKLVSWKWLLSKKISAPCLFYEYDVLTILIV
jgi:hypothetical protein